ncbi:MAG: hypothetical protein WA435_08170 [Gallionellaceae bacterium]
MRLKPSVGPLKVLQRKSRNAAKYRPNSLCQYLPCKRVGRRIANLGQGIAIRVMKALPMETIQSKKSDELRMSSDEFECIMREALKIHLEETPKKKITVKTKPKAVRKKGNTK